MKINNTNLNNDIKIKFSGQQNNSEINTVFETSKPQEISDKGLVVEQEKISPKGSTAPAHLKNAPSPVIVVAGEKKFAAIVVDTKTNRLYKYDADGNPEIVYSVATGKKYTPTHKGIRQIDHIETYPYKSAYGTKRKRNPKAYGPNVLYLVTVDPKTGNITGSDGQFIHGNNNASSLGNYASLGCVRMDNDVITQLAQTVPEKSYVLIE